MADRIDNLQLLLCSYMLLSTKQAISRLTSPLVPSPFSILALQPVEYDMPGMVFT